MRSLIAVALLLLVLTGCTVRTSIDVTSHPDGAGAVVVTLTLDAEAAARAGDLAAALRTDDLKDAGWNIGDVKELDGGGREVVIRREFATPAEGTAVLQQLTGTGGPFRDFTLTQQKSGLKVDAKFTGTVDLTQGLAAFGDDGLASQFGSRLGFDAAEREAAFSQPMAEAFPIDLAVHLPGSATVESPPTDNGTWHLAYGQVTNLELTHEGTDRGPIVLVGLGAVFVVAIGLVLFFWPRRSGYVPRHGR